MINEQIIDNPNALDQYIEMMGEEGKEFIIDIIDTFLADAPNNFSQLDSSMATNDFSTFRRAAHTLKTGCKTVGATVLGESFLKLEEAGADGNLTSVGGLFMDCKSDFRLLETELKKKKSALQ